MLKLDVILLYFNIEKSLQRSKRRRDTKLYPINLKYHSHTNELIF